jgi:hypothetical protein
MSGATSTGEARIPGLQAVPAPLPAAEAAARRAPTWAASRHRFGWEEGAEEDPVQAKEEEEAAGPPAIRTKAAPAVRRANSRNWEEEEAANPAEARMRAEEEARQAQPWGAA